jgi:hypothetical protein
MSEHEIEDVAEILGGYETWMASRNPLLEKMDVSTYLDELAKQRAVDAIEEIRAVYSDPDLTWQEVDAQIRRILGVNP